MLGAAEIRQLAESLDLRPTKKLGQNFVIDPNTIRKIVSAANLEKDDVVVEIGPGLGSLTLGILEQVDQLVVIEIDKRLAELLPATIQKHAPGKKIEIVQADAMTVEKLPLVPTALVANLPYNISVPVLLNILENFPTINRGVVMVQSEVAYRLAARPNNKEYGSPTAKANWWADLQLSGSVGRSVFWPVPNVDSSLVSFIRHAPLGDEDQRVATFLVIDKAFAKRRKMMRSAVGELFDNAEGNLIAAGMDPTIRGEALAINQFFQIGKQLIKHNSTKRVN